MPARRHAARSLAERVLHRGRPRADLLDPRRRLRADHRALHRRPLRRRPADRIAPRARGRDARRAPAYGDDRPARRPVTTDLTEVEQANARFYQAFETLDLARMDLVWAHGEHVKCVHPGWPLLVGWEAVRASWEAIFENTAEMRFTLSDVRSAAGGDLGWVTCTENIFSEVRGRLAVTLTARAGALSAGGCTGPGDCRSGGSGARRAGSA
ncbi:MAG: hypothetical protein DME03_14070 [Candidatus Rokuibacteriota bacterium]|nr:MAG: hypothetical protein DME03_14070 [Candidatus Rokubacteria bacterium]